MAWAPNQLLVKLVAGAPLDEYDCYNMYYGLVKADPLFGTWYTLTFAGSFNVLALAAQYTALDAVEFVDPNSLIGGQNYWEPVDLGNGVWRWTIDDGWHDCFDGCDCHNLYVLDIDAKGNLTLVSYDQFGQSWCEFD